MTRQGVLWSVGALLGIVCTAAVAWSASLLAGQHIGLAGVPLSAASGLAPTSTVRVRKPARHKVSQPTAVLPVPARPQPATAAPTIPQTPTSSAPAAPPSPGRAAPATTSSSSPPTRPSPSRHDDGGAASPGASDSRQRDD